MACRKLKPEPAFETKDGIPCASDGRVWPIASKPVPHCRKRPANPYAAGTKETVSGRQGREILAIAHSFLPKAANGPMFVRLSEDDMHTVKPFGTEAGWRPTMTVRWEFDCGRVFAEVKSPR